MSLNGQILLSILVAAGIILMALSLRRVQKALHGNKRYATKTWELLKGGIACFLLFFGFWISLVLSGHLIETIYLSGIILFLGAIFVLTSVYLGTRTAAQAHASDDARQFFAGVLQEMGILVFITDENGRITMANKRCESVLQLSENLLVGRPIDEFFLFELPEIQSGMTENGILLPGLKELPVQVSVSDYSAGGKLLRLVTAQDISSLKLQERKLKEYLSKIERSNKDLEQFSYVAAHDLKAPLRAIHNLAVFIEEDLGQVPVPVKRNMELLKGRIHRMEGLVNGILEYARTGKQNVKAELTHTGSMVDEILDNLGARDKSSVTVDEGMPVILTQRILLEQVMANLISNACKYNTHPHPTLHIMARDMERHVEFVVSDNGPGIPADSHAKVFQMFQTLQAKDSYESTGIGLSIVKKIIEEKGGNIEIDSGKGEGCTFRFTWPKMMA
jgi:light-regulated signal transduction histidine kinase (bacteriophytochrome)